MQIYSKKNKNCFFSLISWPILIWFALSDRAKFGTLNSYTELWDFALFIIYGTLCKWNEIMSLPGHQIFIFWPVQKCTTSNLRYLLLRDADERYVIDVLVYHIELRYAGETAESVSLATFISRPNEKIALVTFILSGRGTLRLMRGWDFFKIYFLSKATFLKKRCLH